MSGAPEREIQSFPTPEAWEAWLAQHHATSTGLWLKLAKKQSGIESVTYDEALEVALCYGWIDGQKDRFDEEWWLQRFTPRRPRSKWSKINRTRATALIESGRMQPAGLREIERAKAAGRWEAAYDPPSKLTVPDDLEQALAQNERARNFFATLDRTNRYAILYRILDARKPETRARRIEEFVAMLAEQRKPYP
jgi:uncharacterized protein YdeI (YjbR/CyaY-like superfamily)